MSHEALSPEQFDDYRGEHQPTQSYGAPAHDLTQQTDETIYTHPHYFTNMPESKESIRQIRAVRGKPDAHMNVYRAAPSHVTHINPGDWVTPSRKYAELHAESQGNRGRDYDPANNWPVLHARVPAKHVHWPGDDVNEFGYFGPQSVPGR
jgi:hypothetical protein